MFSTRSSMPTLLLRLESLAMFAGSLAVYAHLNGDGWLFLALFFVPDVSVIGYVANPRLGSRLYNLVHTYATVAAAGALALAAGWTLGVQFALIWAAHLAFDRTLGYGLKYASGFKDTHLQRI
jgi:Domain of unknown function (DUF4260)